MRAKLADKIIGIAALTLMGLIIWVEFSPKHKPIAPDVHMLTECDSFVASLHIMNLDNKPIYYTTKVYIDTNDNNLLDSSDVFIYSHERNRLLPYGEYVNKPIKPLDKYKGYSLIAEITTDDMVVYYLSIPCDVNMAERNFTPSK